MYYTRKQTLVPVAHMSFNVKFTSVSLISFSSDNDRLTMKLYLFRRKYCPLLLCGSFRDSTSIRTKQYLKKFNLIRTKKCLGIKVIPIVTYVIIYYYRYRCCSCGTVWALPLTSNERRPPARSNSFS